MEESVGSCCDSQKIAVEQESASLPSAQPKSVRRFLRVERGIYQDMKSSRFYERPTINGQRTWRKLVGSNLKFSREEYYRRRTAIAYGHCPHCEEGRNKPPNKNEN